jgi:hypothetical protein
VREDKDETDIFFSFFKQKSKIFYIPIFRDVYDIDSNCDTVLI